MADVLDNILSFRKKALEEAKAKTPLYELEKKAQQVQLRDFYGAVTSEKRISVIAEMKQKSPSAGQIRETYDVKDIAALYQKGGARALSVLTEKDFFGGDVSHIEQVRSGCSLPILRKDFVFDAYQVIEAKAYGADAVLLIAEMLSAKTLKELVDCAKEVHIEPLVEFFSSDTLPVALNSGARLIGINTRNLKTLEMHPENIATLSQLIPRDRAIVAESGIKSGADVEKLKALRVSAVLVGESLLKQKDLESAVRVLAQSGLRS